MPNPLMDILSGLGNVLDTPGSVVRGLLAGDPSSALGGVLDPSKRVSGRGLLDKWGITNADSGTLGDIGGFAAQVATDPLTWLGGTLAKSILGRGGVKAAEAGEAAAGPGKSAVSTLLEPAPGVGGYKRLADGTIIRTEPLAPAVTGGIGAGGEKTFVAGSNPLTEAEQWRGISPNIVESGASEAAVNSGSHSNAGSLSNDLMDKRRAFTMAKDWDSSGMRLVGGDVYGSSSRAAEVQKGLNELSSFRNEGWEKGRRYAGAYNRDYNVGGVFPEAGSNAGLVGRHETMHGLINEAAKTGDASGLGFVAKLAAKSRESDSPTMRALSSILEETAANAVGSGRGTGGRGLFNQLKGMTSFLSNPHEFYYNNAMRTSPIAAEIYGQSAIPRLALAGAGGGGAALLSALGAGRSE